MIDCIAHHLAELPFSWVMFSGLLALWFGLGYVEVWRPAKAERRSDELAEAFNTGYAKGWDDAEDYYRAWPTIEEQDHG